MIGVFRKIRKKRSAAVFVDFEHWCYSIENQFGMKPDIKAFFEELANKYRIKRIYFFGDFTSPALRNEINNIREHTNNIIDTQNPSQRTKKDYTDFIMLDYMYRDIEEKNNANTYIIFSGDGHFTSVAAYLKNKKHKRIVVYGIENSTSNRLKSVADECIILPTPEQKNTYYKSIVLTSIDRNVSKYGRKHYTTFRKTMETVSGYYGIELSVINNVMNEMIQSGVLVKNQELLGKTRKITTISVNWDCANEEGLSVIN